MIYQHYLEVCTGFRRSFTKVDSDPDHFTGIKAVGQCCESVAAFLFWDIFGTTSLKLPNPDEVGKHQYPNQVRTEHIKVSWPGT